MTLRTVLLALAAATLGIATVADAQARRPAGVRSHRIRQSGPRMQPVPPDSWFGEDKVRHAGASAAIQLIGFGLLRLSGASARASLVGATVVTAAAGIGKELRDARGNGTPSARDLVWDGIGILAGTGLARLGDGR